MEFWLEMAICVQLLVYNIIVLILLVNTFITELFTCHLRFPKVYRRSFDWAMHQSWCYLKLLHLLVYIGHFLLQFFHQVFYLSRFGANDSSKLFSSVKVSDVYLGTRKACACCIIFFSLEAVLYKKNVRT